MPPTVINSYPSGTIVKIHSFLHKLLWSLCFSTATEKEWLQVVSETFEKTIKFWTQTTESYVTGSSASSLPSPPSLYACRLVRAPEPSCLWTDKYFLLFLGCSLTASSSFIRPYIMCHHLRGVLSASCSITSCSLPWEHLLQPAITVYVHFCGCLMCSLPARLLVPSG